ncbi:MAG: RCC1 domain-containing protein [Actinomycetota bacterium]|nr:RCC1 domain-containing protein [Actinomycetota bacterium]
MITRRVLAILAVVVALSLAGTPASADRGGLVEVGLDGKVVQLVADGDSTCALTEDGEVYCWGAGYPGPYRPARNPLLLVVAGVLLIAAGTGLLKLSRRP